MSGIEGTGIKGISRGDYLAFKSQSSKSIELLLKKLPDHIFEVKATTKGDLLLKRRVVLTSRSAMESFNPHEKVSFEQKTKHPEKYTWLKDILLQLGEEKPKIVSTLMNNADFKIIIAPPKELKGNRVVYDPERKALFLSRKPQDAFETTELACKLVSVWNDLSRPDSSYNTYITAVYVPQFKTDRIIGGALNSPNESSQLLEHLLKVTPKKLKEKSSLSEHEEIYKRLIIDLASRKDKEKTREYLETGLTFYFSGGSYREALKKLDFILYDFIAKSVIPKI